MHEREKKHASDDLAPACMDVDRVILVEDRTPSNYSSTYIYNYNYNFITYNNNFIYNIIIIIIIINYIYKLLTESTRTNSVRIIWSVSAE